MAAIIKIPTIQDHRGEMCVIENLLDFKIERIFYIYNVPQDKIRGGHCHHKNRQALVSLAGSCKIRVRRNNQEEIFLLDSPDKLLVLDLKDWHQMFEFNDQTVLLVLNSEKYDAADYIYEQPSEVHEMPFSAKLVHSA